MSDLTPADWRAQPWKNGRGTTHQIIRRPDRDDYDVRVSFVELAEPGPFSTFPGYRRWTVVLDGALVLDGRRVDPLIELDGAAQLTAELPAGPTRVLNVLARPGLVEVGVGASPAPVWFAFAFGDNPLGLPLHHARLLEQPAIVRGSLAWLRWRA